MGINLRCLAKSFQPRQWFDDGEPDPYDYVEDTLMWVYRKNAEGKFEVGFFMPDKQWCGESVYDTADEAAARVNYLNGGKPRGGQNEE